MTECKSTSRVQTMFLRVISYHTVLFDIKFNSTNSITKLAVIMAQLQPRSCDKTLKAAVIMCFKLEKK